MPLIMHSAPARRVSVPAGTILFADGFETGDLSFTQNSARWGGGKGTENVSVVSTYPYSGTYSARLRYVGTVTGGDGWSQLAFDLGASFSEVTIRFKWRIPENYAHRSDSPGNNKLFRIWPDDGVGGEDGYGYREKVGASLFRGASDSSSTLWGEWDDGASGITARGTPFTDFVSASDFGTWADIELYCKMPSAANAANGIIRVTKSGIVALNMTNVNNWGSGAARNFRYGYLMGWANSGFTNTTDFYIDDVSIVAAP